MVAGEFAVLEPDKSLVVMAVDRFVYVTLDDAVENCLSLTDLSLPNLAWHYLDGKVKIESDDPRISFVKEAMGVALLYLEEIGVTTSAFSLSVKSELDDTSSGLKYGLGSSAAVVTAVVTAVLQKFSPGQPNKLLLFKLAAIAHVRIQGNGSGADIAASTYGGLLHYKSFQADILLKELEMEQSIKQMVEKKWRYLLIEQVQVPSELTLCVGWTGSPAATGSLVREIAKLKRPGETAYNTFLAASDLAVADVLAGMRRDDTDLFLKGLEANRLALAQLGIAAGVAIETELLFTLADIAKEIGGAGKLSGAGGGDCGIAYVQSASAALLLRDAWERCGIKALSLAVYEA